MNYKQLTENKRYQIDVLNKAGYINPAFTERLLGLEPICPAHAAVDHNQGFQAAEQAGDALLKIAQGVAMLGKDHQLLPG